MCEFHRLALEEGELAREGSAMGADPQRPSFDLGDLQASPRLWSRARILLHEPRDVREGQRSRRSTSLYVPTFLASAKRLPHLV